MYIIYCRHYLDLFLSTYLGSRIHYSIKPSLSCHLQKDSLDFLLLLNSPTSTLKKLSVVVQVPGTPMIFTDKTNPLVCPTHKIEINRDIKCNPEN